MLNVPENEEHTKCGICHCGKDTKYVIAYDYIYDGDRQTVLCCTWSWVCAKHLKQLISVLKKASKEYAVYRIKTQKVKVEFT